MGPRTRAALAFAAVGAAAAAVHVLTDTPGNVRDWRQTLPLAAVLGAALGAGLRPASAASGLAAAVLGMAGFAVVFALGHGLIDGGGAAEAFDRAARALVAPAGACALGFAAVAGWLLGSARRP
jgi:hypothetical protein